MIRATLLTLALAGTLPAQPAPPPQGPMQGGHRPAPPDGPGRILKALALTPDQEQAVHAVMEKGRAKAMAARDEAHSKEEALRAALEDPTIPEAQLRALHAAASEARLQDLLAHRATLLEIEAVLTPEQRAKARRIRANQAREREARRAVMEDLGGPEGRPGPPR